jgi:hypothetical protein
MKLIVALLSSLLASVVAQPSDEAERIHCNLSALSKAERARDAELVVSLRETLHERKELPDGYAYRFEPAAFKEVSEWLQIVAKCCQPLTYDIALSPQPGGALWVTVTGQRGAKEFIELEFSHLTERLSPAGAAR